MTSTSTRASVIVSTTLDEGERFRADTGYSPETVEIDQLNVTFHEASPPTIRATGLLIRKDGSVGLAHRTQLLLSSSDVPQRLRARLAAAAHVAATRLADHLRETVRDEARP